MKIADATNIYFGSTEAEAVYLADEMVWPHVPEQHWLKFTALETGTFSFTMPADIDTSFITSISYSTNNGRTWTTVNNSSSNVVVTTPTIKAGKSVYWKGLGTRTSYYESSDSTNHHANFSSTGNFEVSGWLTSLLYGDNFTGKKSISDNYKFAAVFWACSKLISADKLKLGEFYSLTDYIYASLFYMCSSLTTPPALPATTLVAGAYGAMFSFCTSLTTPPALPATTLGRSCYREMFYGCTSLTTTPVLPAKTLAEHCYHSMFSGCTSLTTASALPATTLVTSCYENMFKGCTSLTTAPVLPATTLVSRCYDWLFKDCSSLNYIKAMFTTTPSSSYTGGWVDGVSSSGTFVKNSSASWSVRGVNGIPNNWTISTASS